MELIQLEWRPSDTQLLEQRPTDTLLLGWRMTGQAPQSSAPYCVDTSQLLSELSHYPIHLSIKGFWVSAEQRKDSCWSGAEVGRLDCCGETDTGAEAGGEADGAAGGWRNVCNAEGTETQG